MEKKELFSMAERLKLPEPVLSPLAAAAKSLPEGLPIEELTEPETAAAAWKTVSAQLPAWQEDNGMAQLAVMLAAVCQTEKRYRRENIPAEVFSSTMDCFRRFAGDYRLYDVDEGDQEFYEWLFGGYKPLEKLPEYTSLQRAVKAHLAAGGRLGMARGTLTLKTETKLKHLEGINYGTDQTDPRQH